MALSVLLSLRFYHKSAIMCCNAFYNCIAVIATILGTIPNHFFDDNSECYYQCSLLLEKKCFVFLSCIPSFGVSMVFENPSKGLSKLQHMSPQLEFN
ncbi:hypothetical protein P3S68_023337 [Capsicum galapagoense]